MSKGLTLLAQMGIFDDDIREWRRQDMDKIQLFFKMWEKYKYFSPSAPRAEKSGNNRRKRRVHYDSAKHLRFNTSLSRRAPWGDWRHTNNHVGNLNTRIRYGRTGTSQFSTYQIKICGNSTVGTDECDHERHAGATKTTRLSTKQPSEAKKKVLLMELWDQFHSWDKNLLSKESGTLRGIVL